MSELVTRVLDQIRQYEVEREWRHAPTTVELGRQEMLDMGLLWVDTTGELELPPRPWKLLGLEVVPVEEVSCVRVVGPARPWLGEG